MGRSRKYLQPLISQATNLGERYLKLSSLPRGNQLNTFGRSSFSDNPGLCGEPQPYRCDELNTLPPSANDSDMLDVPMLIVDLTGYISGLVVGVVLINSVIEGDAGMGGQNRGRVAPD
ncbi:hypothetical protein PanWU01x14_169420 [Parasponia andersonii]|uniref:LRR domain containing protein n=1 Tax=Parasponia andersonii TaxID=3476 RepID=A0A2P5CAG2_PARAD|nr:hypothetical protein PanWU01x14_169420 [Parasponia andersonii]